VSEHRWERKLFAIPVWVLVLGGVLLALRKERVLLRGHRRVVEGLDEEEGP
jgi:hypothetical protein